MEKPGMMKPALVVGVISGVLLSIPFLRMINCACCVGTMATGLVAAMLYSKSLKAAGLTFNAAAGAKAGLLAGAISSVIAFVLGYIFDITLGSLDGAMINEAILRWMENNPDIPEESLVQVEEQLENARNGTIPTSELLQRAVISVVIAPIFGAIGGLMAGSLFKDKDEPQAAPPANDAPPPAAE